MGSAVVDRPVEILLVEDNPGDARLAAEALRENAFSSRLHWAADGIQAMEFLRREGKHAVAPRPDLILLDLNLPGKDGREILSELKGDPALRGIPVIVLTCSRAESDRAAAYDLQASCCVTKPLEWGQFLETVKAIGDFWLTHVALPDRETGEPSSRPGDSGPEARAAGRPGALKILLVEDNPGDARLVREMLEEAGDRGTRIVEVDRLGAGVERLGKERFDAVILDLSLPDSQGLETLATINARASGVPLVVLTGLEEEETANRALRQGAQDYLVKGKFDGHLLVRAVGHAIERGRSSMLVRYLAQHDPLTELPNRLLFQDRLGQAVEHARRDRQNLAVLFVDLDDFKTINDTLGHAVGDQLLAELAERLRGCVRASDTVARVGGDEFTILLPEIARPEDVTTVIGKVMQVFRKAFHLAGHEKTVSASMGVSLYPDDGEDAESLVRNADAAMYHAKKAGRAQCRFHSAPGPKVRRGFGDPEAA